MVFSGKTKIYGVIGDPIQHSLSPILHNAAFEVLRLDCAFLAFKVKPEEVGNAIAGMRSLNISGLNVTMPHKSAVIDFLDELDKTAKTIGSVNTITNKEGKLLGSSTDGIGAHNALKENGIDPKGKKVLLLGAGGAAKAIAFTIAQEADQLVILNRTAKQATDLANLVKQTINRNVIADAFLPTRIKQEIASSDILINATSVGMNPNSGETPIPANLLKPNLAVMDIVYNPLETRLTKDAKATGSKVVGGLEMLVYQGAASFEIWTGVKAPVEIMKKAALTYLAEGVKN